MEWNHQEVQRLIKFHQRYASPSQTRQIANQLFSTIDNACQEHIESNPMGEEDASEIVEMLIQDLQRLQGNLERSIAGHA